MSFLRMIAATLLISILLSMLVACQSYKDGSSRTIGEFTDDVGIQASIKTAFFNDDEINGMIINIEVRKGVVELYGRIPSETLRKKAVAMAGRVKGVAKVEDRLTLVRE